MVIIIRILFIFFVKIKICLTFSVFKINEDVFFNSKIMKGKKKYNVLQT